MLDTPKWSGNAFLAYGFPLGATHAQMRVDYQYHGSQLRDFASSFTSTAANGMPELVDNFNQRVAAYSLVNLNFSLRHRNWEGSLFANNLLNTRPVIDFNPTNTFTQAFTVRPRTIGLSVRTHL
ncbi:MAG: hypothetical protein JWN85_1864 [Gammaproteobacteria bacterium]|nr:hypothetical protein [Gammaproteobacteria bacterium]